MKIPVGRPDVRRYETRFEPAAAQHPHDLRATFLGVSTVLFRAGDSAIMTDGFFTRPGLLRTLARKVAPDRAMIAGSLRRLAVRRLAAVIPVHSHYDHAMDAPVVAELTGATVIGSESTANIALGHRLPAERVRTPRLGEPIRLGRFTVRLLPGEHSPKPLARGHIARPLTPPARATDYRMGECYAVHIECDGRRILVNGSAGFVPGALQGYQADVVYFGVPTLGRQTPEFREALWREVVETTGARRVVPVHWDDFWRPLHRPLVPMRRFADDLDVTMAFLLDRTERTGVDVRLPVAWRVTDPFTGLE